MINELALFGGSKVRKTPFPYPPYPVIGAQERQAVLKALEEKELSTFLSSANSANYLGAGFAKKLESVFCSYYKTKYAVSTDSGTAALHAALVAAGVSLGDEVIVTPWSFSSSAKAALFVNAIPVFSDIEDKTFCLDPDLLEKNISRYTKAIIVVHLFGHPARMDGILKIAKKYGIIVIEDCAQAHGAQYHGKKVGTLGDIGVFSLNATKQIAVGEGGMLITNNKNFAQRAQLLRNHGEVWGPFKTKKEMTGILGRGYLLDEMSAAMGVVQMQKIDKLFSKRTKIAEKLDKSLSKFPFLQIPVEEKNCQHAYYSYVLKFDEKKAGMTRKRFAEAMRAEGIPLGEGYVEPLYWNPVYKWKLFYGVSGFPYNNHPRKITYNKGDCPVVERLYAKEALSAMWTHPSVRVREIKDIVRAVEKVYSFKNKLNREK